MIIALGRSYEVVGESGRDEQRSWWVDLYLYTVVISAS